jgi:hypothetical protein
MTDRGRVMAAAKRTGWRMLKVRAAGTIFAYDAYRLVHSQGAQVTVQFERKTGELVDAFGGSKTFVSVTELLRELTTT